MTKKQYDKAILLAYQFYTKYINKEERFTDFEIKVLNGWTITNFKKNK